jgi:hypothetical protein
MRLGLVAFFLTIGFVNCFAGSHDSEEGAVAGPQAAPLITSGMDEFAQLELLYSKGQSLPLSEVEGKDSDQEMTCYAFNPEDGSFKKVAAYTHFYGEFPKEGEESEYERKKRLKTLGLQISLFKTFEERAKKDIKDSRKESANIMLPFLKKDDPIQDGALFYTQGFGAGSAGFMIWKYFVRKVTNPQTGKEERIIKHQLLSTAPRSTGERLALELYCK